MTKSKAIIVGASSGIGQVLARILIDHGYRVGITGRRQSLLQGYQSQLGSDCVVQSFDVSQIETSIQSMKTLIDKLGGLDLLVISAGVGFINEDLDWEKEAQTIAVNVTGFAALAALACRYFLKQGYGHIVGISSIGALRGNGQAPAYNASKAFMSNYLEGLRQKLAKEKGQYTVSNIQPGFVDTAMAKGEIALKKIPVEKAAQQIFDAIEKKRSHAYISKRWRLFAWLYKSLPDFLFLKI
jgi:short-subunit dehydrogenase